MPTLTVLMGAPGSGKTTWSRTRAVGHLVASTDPLRTEEALRGQAATAAFLGKLQRKTEQALGRGQDVIVDACNIRAHERARWLGVARRMGARAHLVAVQAPLATLLRAQEGRAYPVHEAKVRAYVQGLGRALPKLGTEGWDEVTHVHRDGGSGYRERPRRVSSW